MKFWFVLCCVVALTWGTSEVSEKIGIAAAGTEKGMTFQAGFAAPDVVILEPDKNVTSVDQPRLMFRALLVSYSSDLKEAVLSVNNNVRSFKLSDKPQRKYVLESELVLEEGVNVISLVATNKTVSSKPELRRITYTPRAATKPNLFVLAIGVSTYADPDLRVKFAGSDAAAVLSALEAQAGEGKVFGEVKKHPLVNAEATRSEIIKGLDWLNQATAQDTRVLFISGAMRQDVSGSPYFLPADYTANSEPAVDGVPYFLFWSKLADSGGKAIILLDIDQSLSHGRSGITDMALKHGYGGRIFTYSAFSESETPIETRDEWRHRAFTRALLEGLAGDADLGPKDDVIDSNELGRWLKGRIPELTDNQQHPLFFGVESSALLKVARRP